MLFHSGLASLKVLTKATRNTSSCPKFGRLLGQPLPTQAPRSHLYLVFGHQILLSTNPHIRRRHGHFGPFIWGPCFFVDAFAISATINILWSLSSFFKSAYSSKSPPMKSRPSAMA